MPNFLECTGQPPTSLNYPTENVKVLRLGNAALKPQPGQSHRGPFKHSCQVPSRREHTLSSCPELRKDYLERCEQSYGTRKGS